MTNDESMETRLRKESEQVNERDYVSMSILVQRSKRVWNMLRTGGAYCTIYILTLPLN